jgi:Metal-dependent hydrolase
MINHTKLLLVLLLISGFHKATYAQSAPTGGDNPTFKVLSYNLRFGELASLEELAEFIKKQEPDIVALQEVDVHTQRERAPAQHGKDFATELGFRTGMFAAYGKTIPYAGGYYGIAILSKYPLAKVERIYLPKTEHGKEQRAVLVAEVEYQEGRFLTFASTHLDYTNTQERQSQVAALNRVLVQDQRPVIVAGDFNARPDATEIREGMADWLTASNLEPTVPADKPRNTIDYIFCYPKGKWKTLSNTTHQVPLSDHLPIDAVVELQ